MLKKERNYINEVLDYETKYKANNGGKNGHEPIMLKLLLSIFIRLGDLLVVFAFLFGALLLILFKHI